MWEYRQKSPSTKHSSGPHQTPNLSRSCPFQLSGCEKQISILYKPPRLWYFVMQPEYSKTLCLLECQIIFPAKSMSQDLLLRISTQDMHLKSEVTEIYVSNLSKSYTIKWIILDPNSWGTPLDHQTNDIPNTTHVPLEGLEKSFGCTWIYSFIFILIYIRKVMQYFIK
jgi:hypothetical protein